VAALLRLVRKRFAGNRAEGTALEAAQAAPQDRAAVEELARILERAAAADAGFGARLRALWPDVQAELSPARTAARRHSAAGLTR
jgi:hypothetical protein